VSKKDELTVGLESTLNLLKLAPSDLKKAQQVVAGENRPDILVTDRSSSVATDIAKVVPTPSIVPMVGTPSIRPGDVLNASLAKVKRVSGRKAKVSNYYTMDRIETRFRDDQIDFLTNLELQFRRRDEKKGPRITKATIIRALVDLLPNIEIDITDVIDEESLREQIFKQLGIGKQRSKPS
jgi:hypothetical protein